MDKEGNNNWNKLNWKTDKETKSNKELMEFIQKHVKYAILSFKGGTDMKKILILLLVLSLFLVGCGDTSAEVDKEPTQEELNESLKEEAIEADYAKIENDEVEEGTKLTVRGEVIGVEKEGSMKAFVIGASDGAYMVQNMATNDVRDVREGDYVQIWGVYDGKSSEAPTMTTTIVEIIEASEEEETKVGEVPIHPDSIAMDIEILEPNSIGTVYLEATYLNGSEYPITSYKAKVHLKDTNDTAYLLIHDTVMPGEKSATFTGFGPETRLEEDYEILTLEVTARTEEGNKLYIDYDFQLEEASWFESKN